MPSPEPVHITTSAHGHIATVQLSRPPVNALDDAVKHAMLEAVTALHHDHTLRCVILLGGERFSAGDDIAEMADWGPDYARHTRELISELCTAVAELPMPVIAAVSGFALGGGCELAMAADFRVTTPEAQWGLPEIHLGLMPAGGGTQRLLRLVGLSRAREMLFTGTKIDGATAVQAGLADHCVADPVAVAYAMAESLSARAPLAIRAIKQSLAAATAVDPTALALETALFLGLMTTEDAQTGLQAFLDRTEPRFTGR